MTKFTALAAVAALALLPAAANAALLAGQTVEYTYLFPTQFSNFDGPVNLLVGPGVEKNNVAGASGFTLDISDTNLLFNSSVVIGQSFTAAAFNGVRIFDFSGSIASFTAVTINASSTWTTFDASRISFDANTILLNFQGLTIDGASLSIDINGDAVPEPAALALLGMGILGIAAARRRKA